MSPSFSGGVEAALDLAFEKARGKDVVLFGASLTAQCLRAGLVESYQSGQILTLRLRPRS
jgi:dihydrofolate reductase